LRGFFYKKSLLPTYKQKKAKEVGCTDEEHNGSKKVKQVLKLFEAGKDAKEVAKELGFKNHLTLAEIKGLLG